MQHPASLLSCVEMLQTQRRRWGKARVGWKTCLACSFRRFRISIIASGNRLEMKCEDETDFPSKYQDIGQNIKPYGNFRVFLSRTELHVMKCDDIQNVGVWVDANSHANNMLQHLLFWCWYQVIWLMIIWSNHDQLSIFPFVFHRPFPAVCQCKTSGCCDVNLC